MGDIITMLAIACLAGILWVLASPEVKKNSSGVWELWYNTLAGRVKKKLF